MLNVCNFKTGTGYSVLVWFSGIEMECFKCDASYSQRCNWIRTTVIERRQPSSQLKCVNTEFVNDFRTSADTSPLQSESD